MSFLDYALSPRFAGSALLVFASSSFLVAYLSGIRRDAMRVLNNLERMVIHINGDVYHRKSEKRIKKYKKKKLSKRKAIETIKDVVDQAYDLESDDE
jgi:hypothetical protein